MAPKTVAAKAAAKAVAVAKAKAARLAVGAPTDQDAAAAEIEREITAERAAGALLTPVLPAALGTPGRVGTSLTPRPSPRPSRTGSPAGGEDHLAPLDTRDENKDKKEHKKRRHHSGGASDGGERSRRRRRRSDEARHMFEGLPFF